MKARHNHILELQSLRGIAAGVVLLHHTSFLFDTTPAFHYWAEILINAHAAVMLFFVLSGYVLSRALSGVAMDGESLFSFYAARLFRIYPMAWVACLAAILYVIFLHSSVPTIGTSQWYAHFSQLSFIDLKAGAMAFLTFKAELLPPIWSIRVEVFGSLAIPLIVLAIRRGVGIELLAAITAFSLWSSSTVTIYLPSFILGALAFRFQDRLGRYLGAVPALVASTIALLFFRRISADWRFDVCYHAVVPALIESVSAATLIIGIVERTWSPLRSKAAVRLGDISYSLYLIHFIIMSITAKFISRWLVDGDSRAVALMASTLLMTLPLAVLTYEMIEKPGIIVGKKIAGTFRSHVVRLGSAK
jgi:peptidoglycan/LPS O-acetylase OafA/YrhL